MPSGFMQKKKATRNEPPSKYKGCFLVDSYRVGVFREAAVSQLSIGDGASRILLEMEFAIPVRCIKSYGCSRGIVGPGNLHGIVILHSLENIPIPVAGKRCGFVISSPTTVVHAETGIEGGKSCRCNIYAGRSPVVRAGRVNEQGFAYGFTGRYVSEERRVYET